jgi:sigma-B regulation protein RsbQ
VSKNVLERNNVHVSGSGQPMLFVHGFGCDQNMWRLVAPAFVDDHQVVAAIREFLASPGCAEP